MPRSSASRPGSPTSWKRLHQAPSPTSLESSSDVLALVDHDPSRVLARTRSGNLRLAEDKRGLAFDLDVPDTSARPRCSGARRARRSRRGKFRVHGQTRAMGRRTPDARKRGSARGQHRQRLAGIRGNGRRSPRATRALSACRRRTPLSGKPVMGILARILGRVPERRSTSVSSWDLMRDTQVGAPVGPHLAENLSAVFACVQIIAETVATLPLIVYRR